LINTASLSRETRLWITGKNSGCQPKLEGIFGRCRLDQLPDAAQVLLGGTDVAQTDPPDCATVQLSTRKCHPANSGLVKI
jgi:hypothetical protein